MIELLLITNDLNYNLITYVDNLHYNLLKIIFIYQLTEDNKRNNSEAAVPVVFLFFGIAALNNSEIWQEAWVVEACMFSEYLFVRHLW